MLKNVKIRTKFIIAFLPIIVLVVFASIPIFLEYVNVRNDLRQVSESTAFEHQGAHQMSDALYNAQTSIQEYMKVKLKVELLSSETDLTPSAADVEKEIFDSLDEFEGALRFSRRATEGGFQKAREFGEDEEEAEGELEELQLLDEIEADYLVHKKAVSQLIEIEKTNFILADKFLEETMNVHYEDVLLPKIELYEEDAREEAFHEDQEILAAIGSTNVITIIMTAIALLVAAVLSISVSLSLIRRVGHNRDAAVEIASGNMTVKMDTSGKDEIAEVAQAIDIMRESLRLSGYKGKQKKETLRKKMQRKNRS